MNREDIIKKIFAEALKSVRPDILVKESIERVLSEYADGDFRQIILIGTGKAACNMAVAAEESKAADLIKDGIVITKYGHASCQSTEHRAQNIDLKNIKIFEAGHPVPDENGIRATEEVIKLMKDADRETLVLCLLSGGSSSLLVSPYHGITLRDKQKITELLLKAGADISELNAVRKHLSNVKGGRLAEIARPAKVLALIISDVVGDRLDVIASGPVSPDETTFGDVLDVVNKYDLFEKFPRIVTETLIKGRKGEIPETPKREDDVFKNVKNFIIGNNLKALNAAKDEAERLGLETEITSSEITGEAREVGKQLARKAIQIKGKEGTNLPAGRQGHRGTICLISGGETTVTVTGSGKGGRNSELALSFAKEIEGIEGITLLSAATDGIDGTTDAAGAIIDGQTIIKAKSLGLDADSYLNNNDSYSLLEKTGSLLITGPTGTNVMDMQIILIE